MCVDVLLATEKSTVTRMSATIMAMTICFVTKLPKRAAVSVIATAVSAIAVPAAFPKKAGTFL
ncbi:hypothetical protein BRE01_01320 [Brevibacillus reuszeri]|uniref:Uncharacterized protein n=1 Tax=Brevibacillus reuszeri TaxID=54915 RepID=A0A0K9YRF1_9BACL|nr:hypothetical protein ADS79_21040 [Brevibacillus reuszeri]GED66430.1 hypothetical protein BRE01_01320 [Brevibacillus reuszeri]